MTHYTFQSHLASRMNDFVAFKQLQGYDYTHPPKHLWPFDRFLADQGFDKPYLTPDIVEAYLAHTQSLAPGTRYTRLSVLRQFSRYLHQLEPASHLLGQLPVKRPNWSRYYLYDDDELQTLMHATRNLSPASSLRPHTYYTLIGLLYTTGLRIDEALSLNLRDVRLDEKLLDVRLGKFAKARLLPLDDSTVGALHAYESLRRAGRSTEASEPFFISRWGRRLKYRTVARTFRKLTEREGIGTQAEHPPRLHDFRHTFATRCLLKWYRQDKDVNAMLPILATYLPAPQRGRQAWATHPSTTLSCISIFLHKS